MDERVIIRPATSADAVLLAAKMRRADCLEIQAATGHTPIEALRVGLRDSIECWCAHVDGAVLAIWGVVADGTLLCARGGVGWLLTSESVDRYPMLFWRTCKAELAHLLDRWDVLVNAIDARHVRALRWATRLGFYLEAPEPWGVAGLPFRRATICKEGLRCASR